MQYLITFLEGLVTFVSPCVLPLLPVYVLYFAGGREQGKGTVKNALGAEAPRSRAASTRLQSIFSALE